MELIQATCVTLQGRGVLLCGLPGSGKSDLALRLIDRGALLIADDLVEIEARTNSLVGRFPTTRQSYERVSDLLGVLEVRGLGLLRVAFSEETVIALVVDLDRQAERVPERLTMQMLGITIPWMALDAFAASAAAKIHAALNWETVDG